MKWDLPDNVNPPNTICVQFQVPDDPKYVAAFWGAILDLTVGFNWANDSGHTAKRAARRMRQMYLDAQLNNCAVPPIPSGGGADGDSYMLRQNPTNPCLLETSVDGVTWCVWADLSKCVPNPAPGGGSTPPGAGKCNEYQISIDSHAVTLMPFVANTGDTLQLESVSGASTDGTPVWYCPDGSIFYLGACAGGGSTVSGDPAPTVNHQALLWKIGSNYYPITSALFTVPAGVTAQPVYIQTNDASLTNNSGTYQIKFTFCNHQAVPPGAWCFDQNLQPSPSGWSFGSNPSTSVCGGTYAGTLGSWVSGKGLDGTHLEQSDCVHDFSDLRAQFDLGASVPFTVEVKGHGNGDNTGASFVQIYVSNDPTFTSGVVLLINQNPLPVGAFDLTNTTSGSFRYILVTAQAINSTATSGADIYVSNVKFSGTGSNPFGSSNC